MHDRVAGGVNEGAPPPLEIDEPGLPELVEVKGQGRAGQPQRIADAARGCSCGPGGHEQAIDFQAGFLGEGRQRGYGR